MAIRLPRTTRRWIYAVAIVPAALLLAPLFAYLFVVRPALPKRSGQIQLPGLIAPVHVARDASGIPHIQAQNSHDLFLAQGFVTAQDRLWSMEAGRRAARGVSAHFSAPCAPFRDVLQSASKISGGEGMVEHTKAEMAAKRW
ncbi:MAG: penicillin acylase family protein, partial [Leptospirales bacterium]|nr:penicillin acylase family protein [Leptospirales bacterium]